MPLSGQKIRWFISIGGLISVAPALVSAQPAIPTGRVISITELIDFAQSFGGFLWVVGEILIGIGIIVAGILYLVSGSDSAKVKKAKDVLKGAVIGALILFGVGVIIAVIRGLVSNPLGFFN